MGALDIDTYKPTFTKTDIKKIVEKIAADIDVYDELVKSETYKCENGIEIEVEVEYKGFDYRIINLKYLDVYNGEEILEDLRDMIWEDLEEAIQTINYKEEENYEPEKEYQDNLIRG